MQCFITRAPCDWKAAEHSKDDTKLAKKMRKIAELGAESEKCQFIKILHDHYTALQEEISKMKSQGKGVSKFKLQWLQKLEKHLEKALNSASESGSESGGGSEDEGERTKWAKLVASTFRKST